MSSGENPVMETTWEVEIGTRQWIEKAWNKQACVERVRLRKLWTEQGDEKRSQAFVEQTEELLQQVLSDHGMESKVSGSHQKIPDKITGKVFISFPFSTDSSKDRWSIVLPVTYSSGQICGISKINKTLFSTVRANLTVISKCLHI